MRYLRNRRLHVSFIDRARSLHRRSTEQTPPLRQRPQRIRHNIIQSNPRSRSSLCSPLWCLDRRSESRVLPSLTRWQSLRTLRICGPKTSEKGLVAGFLGGRLLGLEGGCLLRVLLERGGGVCAGWGLRLEGRCGSLRTGFAFLGDPGGASDGGSQFVFVVEGCVAVILWES
jgi:hypothetical protein